ncbi:MAG: type II secretion system protein GspC [Deltaproteobacteria bacterium]
MARKWIDIRLLLDRLSQTSFDLSTIKKYSFLIHLFIIFLFAKSVSDIVISYVDHRMEPQVVKYEAPRFRPPLLPQARVVSLNEFNAITRRNIFNPNAKEEDLIAEILKEGKGLLDESGALPTSLPLELIGTIILSDPKRSVAAIKNTKDNLTESYQVDDLIGEEAKVFKVEAERVYFQNIQTGALEFIALKEDKTILPSSFAPPPAVGAGIRQASEDRFVIDRGALEASVANPSEILTQARAVPNIVDGKIKGFSIFSIKPGSVYEKLGIKNGDIIMRVNGSDLDSPAKALEFYGAISSASEITLDIERAGQRKTVNYSVK